MKITLFRLPGHPCKLEVNYLIITGCFADECQHNTRKIPTHTTELETIGDNSSQAMIAFWLCY